MSLKLTRNLFVGVCICSLKYLICRYNQIEKHLYDKVMQSLVNSNLVVYYVLLRLSMRKRLLMKRLR